MAEKIRQNCSFSGSEQFRREGMLIYETEHFLWKLEKNFSKKIVTIPKVYLANSSLFELEVGSSLTEVFGSSPVD